jgi:AraC-like DNA-binding protein
MGYFDDLEFVNGQVLPGCTAVINHRFRGTYSLEFLLAGRMYYGVDGGRRIVLDRPVAFWQHPRHRYQYCAVDARGWDHHWVLLRGPRARRLIEDALQPLAATGYLFVPEPLVLAQEFRELIALVLARDPRRQPEAVVRLEGIVSRLVGWAAGDRAPAPRHAGVDAVAAAVRAAPCQAHDFAAAARRLGLSYSHFRRLFRQQQGRAPHTLLLETRMQQAAQALREPGRRIKDVAAAAGYADPAQFSKLFKKKIGMGPRQYRHLAPGAGES